MAPGTELPHSKAGGIRILVTDTKYLFRHAPGRRIEKKDQPLARGGGRHVLGDRGIRAVRAAGHMKPAGWALAHHCRLPKWIGL